jgi:hypothetical protein
MTKTIKIRSFYLTYLIISILLGFFSSYAIQHLGFFGERVDFEGFVKKDGTSDGANVWYFYKSPLTSDKLMTGGGGHFPPNPNGIGTLIEFEPYSKGSYFVRAEYYLKSLFENILIVLGISFLWFLILVFFKKFKFKIV